ncbi:hypothetical protein [Jannaschia sp. LMIT008]|uniref:hypothetical protein n=1 Tax=Jannaschia maritima TaxID=3032585 RepID=UPI002810F39D|nr:hypothetical protein [Jannaschia sp. LMIT008]
MTDLRPSNADLRATIWIALGMAVVLGAISMLPHKPFATDDSDVVAAVAALGDAVCPEGWAAEHAARAGLSEAQTTARYVAVSFDASDRTILRRVRAGLQHAASDTDAQIALCVARSRRLL